VIGWQVVTRVQKRPNSFGLGPQMWLHATQARENDSKNDFSTDEQRRPLLRAETLA
jgi:hypothetical protein